jgi:spore coat protein CotH
LTVRRLLLVGLCVLSAVARADEADRFFGGTSVDEVRLTLEPAAWDYLRAHYLEDNWYRAEFEWGGVKLAPIGIRSRGNGSRSPVKPALRLDFNRYRDQRFLGLRALVLNNMVQDPAMLRTHLAMALYRRLGLAASRTRYVRLVVNGAAAGLYIAVEEVGKDFLERHFGEQAGDLFDYSWAGEWNWGLLPPGGSSLVPYPFQPKTHETNPNVAQLERLVTAINQGTELDSAARELIDMPGWLRYLATEWYLAETDGFAGNGGTNNFYLYRRAYLGRWVLIPWDRESTFSLLECPLGWRYERNEFTRRMRASPDLWQSYRGAVGEVLAAATGWLADEAELVWNQIERDAVEDKQKPYGIEEMQYSVAVVKWFVRERPVFVRQVLGEPPPASY